MTNWTVLDKKDDAKMERDKDGKYPEQKVSEMFNVFNKFEDVPKDYRAGIVRRSMFPDDEETMKNVYKI